MVKAVQSFKIPKPQSPVDFRAKTCWILEIFFNHKEASLSGSKRETKQKQRLVLPSPVLQSWYWKFRLTRMLLAKGVYFKESENPRSSVRLYICHNLSLVSWSWGSGFSFFRRCTPTYLVQSGSDWFKFLSSCRLYSEIFRYVGHHCPSSLHLLICLFWR